MNLLRQGGNIAALIWTWLRMLFGVESRHSHCLSGEAGKTSFLRRSVEDVKFLCFRRCTAKFAAVRRMKAERWTGTRLPKTFSP